MRGGGAGVRLTDGHGDSEVSRLACLLADRSWKFTIPSSENRFDKRRVSSRNFEDRRSFSCASFLQVILLKSYDLTSKGQRVDWLVGDAADRNPPNEYFLLVHTKAVSALVRNALGAASTSGDRCQDAFGKGLENTGCSFVWLAVCIWSSYLHRGESSFM